MLLSDGVQVEEVGTVEEDALEEEGITGSDFGLESCGLLGW